VLFQAPAEHVKEVEMKKKIDRKLIQVHERRDEPPPFAFDKKCRAEKKMQRLHEAVRDSGRGQCGQDAERTRHRRNVQEPLLNIHCSTSGKRSLVFAERTKEIEPIKKSLFVIIIIINKTARVFSMLGE
jgi:hypothetical protein